jgi:hypothetical protein
MGRRERSRDTKAQRRGEPSSPADDARISHLAEHGQTTFVSVIEI